MTDEIFKELCKLLDYYQSRGLMSHYYLDSALLNYSKNYMKLVMENPRHKTTRSCDVSWTISGDLLKELFQHHAVDGEFQIGKSRHFRRHISSPLSSYQGLRKFFEKYL